MVRPSLSNPLCKNPAMIIRFDTIPIGARFEFRGHRYEKLAITLACDEDRFGNHFHPATEVLCATPAIVQSQPIRRPLHPPKKHHRIWVDPK